jgi:CrcB protein
LGYRVRSLRFSHTASTSPRVDRRELAAIFAGGFLGAVLRAAVAETWATHPDRWPWATFAVNIAGALALGYFATRLQERLPLSAYRRPFLGTGICGALTTFSTMQVEVLRMLDRHEWALAAGYCAASIAGGFLAVLVATNLVRRVRIVP